MKREERYKLIKQYLDLHPYSGSSQIQEGIGGKDSLITIKKALSEMVRKGTLIVFGAGPSTTYSVSPVMKLFIPFSVMKYFKNDVDKRIINDRFNTELITRLADVETVFSDSELTLLEDQHNQFLEKTEKQSSTLRKKSFETLGIDLSWKSSQIEGNTYSLLETEFLIKEAKRADNKTPEEAIMILNHKEALDYILDDEKEINPLTRVKIETIHEMMVKDLGVGTGLRQGLVRIGGTNYRPLDNAHQIEDAVTQLCEVVNAMGNTFDKALLSNLLISYIQPFEDGNKRTARMISNTIMVEDNHCPLSYRTVDSQEYKKAMLLFYEQNSLIAFKEIFIEQYVYAVQNYF
jgi:Fic family protein